MTLPPGCRVAVIGPSGAGKSTLLRALVAAERPHAGTLRIDGRDPWSLGGGALQRLRRELHFAPQTPPLPPRQRVVTAVTAGRLPRWSTWRALGALLAAPEADLAHAALVRVGLGERLWERVDRLSGGERQRVALARALLADVRALIIDEPLAALDPRLAERMLALLVETARARGATLVCSLHQVELARTHFARVLAVREGRVFFDGPTEALDEACLARLYAGHEEELGGESGPGRPAHGDGDGGGGGGGGGVTRP